ncbi:MAG: PEGA domain-containing protein [Bacteroidota bacterium]
MRFAVLITTILLGQTLYGQGSGATNSDSLSPKAREGWITVQTGPRRADIFLDSVFLGKSPIEKKAIPAGKHFLKIISPDVMAWDRVERTDSLTVVPGEEAKRTIDFGVRVKLNSIPYGATVLQEGREVGVTPLSLVIAGSGQRKFSFRKDGYEEVEASLSDTTAPTWLVRMAPLTGQEDDAHRDIILGNLNGGKTEQWITVASGATMIVSGILSAYLKDKANREFGRYLESQNADFLTSTRSLDRQASTAFILTQISFGVLTYILLSD